jgi:hypothetical protein
MPELQRDTASELQERERLDDGVDVSIRERDVVPGALAENLCADEIYDLLGASGLVDSMRFWVDFGKSVTPSAFACSVQNARRPSGKRSAWPRSLAMMSA